MAAYYNEFDQYAAQWLRNCARWIGERIEAVEAVLDAQPNQQERLAA